MWSKRLSKVFMIIDVYLMIIDNSQVKAKDYEIKRISAKDLSIQEFENKYVNNNIPIIVTNLNLWNNKQFDCDIEGIDKCLNNNEYLLNNVFITTNQHNRFLYFDENQDDETKQTQTRIKMKWNEFKQRILCKTDNINDYKPYLDEKENYYLYGEKLPNSLLNHVNIPSFLPLTNNEDNDNCLIWMSSNKTCSPLHFDFCDGFLCQLNGIKRVCLFKFDPNKFNKFYPFPFNSSHKRQSMINDIHKPDLDKFELFINDVDINCYQGIINKNEGLYIPFSWWHQIESKDKIGSISLSFRWNPYLNQIKNAILTSSKISNKFISDIIFNECIDKTPFYIKNVASIWREIFNSNKNTTETETEKEKDKEKQTEKETDQCSDIDLFDID